MSKKKSDVIQTKEVKAVPSTDSRKQRIQWPPADDKRWETFDEDMVENTLTEVHKKLSLLFTIAQLR